MKLRKILPFLALSLSLILGPKLAKATHIMGGEITWQCQPNGQYVFTLKVYRDCNGVNFNTNGHALEVHNYPAVGAITQIPLTFFSVDDITPACEGSPCATLTPADPDIPGAIEEYVLVSNPVTLNGVPGANGWIFTWTYGDRNAAIDNIVNAQNFGMTLRAKMYAYNGQNANNCFDSSPDFFQKPSTIICAGLQFTYNHSAFDNELDSLAYSWAQPLDGNFCNPPPCTVGGLYVENVNPPILAMDAASGFSYLSPFPDTNLDSRNVPAVLDPETGEISFTSFNQGEFVSVIKVEAWRCGQLIAEIYRELQTVITSGCSANLPPDIPSPFANNTFRDTVKVGDFINFDLSIFDTLRTGNPKDDSLFVFASGQQFGTGFTDSTMGCANPPCATITAATPDTAVGVYTTNFRWQTTCTHIANQTPVCNTELNTYLFSIRAFDDYCPAAGQTIASVFITILAEEQVPHPDIHCADVQSNGDIIIDWNQTPDPDGSFRGWLIYASANRNGPYTLIDSVLNYTTTTYTHVGAGGNNQAMHYIVRARSGCNDGWTILPTDTISSIYHQPIFNNSCVELNWNALDNPWPAGSGANYHIYREYPIGFGFVLYDSSATEFFCDTFNVCTDSVTYRIQLINTGNGCTGSNSNVAGIRFAYPDPLIDAGNNTALCTGQTQVLGGSPTSTGNVSYQWSPSTNLDDDTIANPIASPLDTITYYLTVTDQRGCSSIDSVLLNTSITPVADAGVDTILCYDDYPLQLYGTVSEVNSGRWIGGSGTFNPDRNTLNANYQPSQAEITAGFIDLRLITTNIGVCDQDTDIVRLNIVRFVGNPLATIGNVSCNGGTDGSITLNPSGGFSPFGFVWNDGPTSQNRSNLTAGSYTVTISNTFGCDSILTFNVTEPIVLGSSISASTDASCNGASDGSATVTANGGTAPYTYLWNDPANSTTATVNALAAGSYRVTITDNNGCSTINTSLTINQPQVLVASASLGSNVSCFGANDGSALAAATGGTLPYTFIWDDPGSSTTAGLNAVSAGTYHVTISDQNGCTDSASVSITQPSILNASINSSSNASCNGFANGAARVTASGGTGPYTYLWNDPANTSIDTVSGLLAGTYTVTVTDNQGCNLTASVVISEPSQLTASVAGSTNVSCNGLSDGSAFAAGSGGTSPYNFLWSDPSSTALDTLRNVAAGSYFVTITDANGCTAINSVIISEPNLLLSAINDSTNVSCFGFSDGRAVVNANGGTLPYTYLWSDINSSTTDSINNVPAGAYAVTITDANACSIIDSVFIQEPDSLIASIASSIDVSCFGLSDGSAVAQIQGGTAPFNFIWNDPANTTNDSISNLAFGRYQLTLTDGNNCSDTSSVLINQPQPLISATLLLDSVSCFGLSNGRAVASAGGGTLPYQFNWNDPNSSTGDTITNLSAGTYIVTITDQNSCTKLDSVSVEQADTFVVSRASSIDVSCNGGNDGKAFTTVSGGNTPYSYAWSNNANTDSIVNLRAGVYTLTITDAKQCSDTLSVRINEPAPLLAIIDTSINVSCNGLSDGSALALGSGGTMPYTYLWNDPAATTTAQLSNLSAGTYTLTMTDAQQCITSVSILITEPAILSTNIQSSVDVSCQGGADGTASLTTSGGTQPYTFFWSNNADSSTILNLTAGTYFVTVTDANGCSDVDSVTITQPNGMSLSLDADSISCFGFNDGQVVSILSGGTTPYTYNWSNNRTTPAIANLGPGNYILTVTDLNGCTVTDTAEIVEPPILDLTLTAADTICVNSNKLLVATATGGTGAYQYSWNQNLGNSPAVNVQPTVTTTYSVSVTDANGCPTVTETVEIGVRNIFAESVELSSSGNICLGDSATLTPQFTPSAEAIGPFTYQWNQGLSGTTAIKVSPDTSTSYILQIVDACNNIISDTVRVEVSDPPDINLGDSLIEGCSPLTVTFDNGTPSGFVYFWDFGDGNTSLEATPTHTYTTPGSYSVDYTVSTPQGCLSDYDGDFRVNVLPTPESIIDINPSTADIDYPRVEVYTDVADANSWFWTFGDGDSSFAQNPSHLYSDTGTYTITLIKENSFGCSDTAYATFIVEPSYDIKIPNVFIPNVNGSNGGRYDPNNPNNAVFFPFVEYVDDYRLLIFNRWGEVVFESNDQLVGWDGYYKGELCQADVYVYKLELRFINGQRETKVGDLTLLR